MRKIIDLCKVHYNGRGRCNPVTIEIELRKCGGDETFTNMVKTGNRTPEYIELSICGNIWNSKKTDIYCAGQCLDTISKYVKDMSLENRRIFAEIYPWWKAYHLNGMHAGTPEQENAIREWEEAGNKFDYGKVCEMLKEKGLYEVIFTGKTTGKYYNNGLYKYGHGWVVEDIPEHILKRIRNLMEKYGK